MGPPDDITVKPFEPDRQEHEDHRVGGDRKRFGMRAGGGHGPWTGSVSSVNRISVGSSNVIPGTRCRTPSHAR